MIETYYIGAYWGPRRETIEECTRRAAEFFHNLADCDESLTRWYRGGDSREDALTRPFQASPTHLRHLLLEGRSRTDFGREVMDDLGFALALWSGGADGESVNLNIRCGSYAVRPGINSVVIDLPYEGSTAARLLNPRTARTILENTAHVWQPDWAVLGSNAYDDLVPRAKGKGPRMGWMIYLSRERGDVPPLPGFDLTEVDDHGTLIITTDNRFTADDPLHGAAAAELREKLEDVGLLGPLGAVSREVSRVA